jgi:hypothetical protein
MNNSEAYKFAHECGFKDGEYSIHGYYFYNDGVYT